MAFRPALLVVAAAAAGWPALSCGPSSHTVQVTVDAYISAVSLGDVARILEISAPYQAQLREAATPQQKKELEKRYRSEIERAYILWEQARSTGTLEMDPLGVSLIRSIGLGKEGAAAMPVGTTFDPDGRHVTVRTRALTNYDRITWDALPTGGRMYLMGHPFGSVVNYAPGYDDPSRLKLLATVDLDWTLEHLPPPRPPGAPSDWYVRDVRPVAGTDTAWTPPSVTP
ncbi:MAG: hypothetical protein ACREAA_13860 [Candidatus Polarisedimenticolia bacterium]